jgi:hypothetical protein
MPGQKETHSDEGALPRQQALDKTQPKVQLSRDFKLMPLHLQAQHKYQSRTHHRQQRRSSMHAAAQHDTSEHRESVTLPSCSQEQYNFSGNHGEHSTCVRTVTQQQTHQDLQRSLRTPPPNVDGMGGFSWSAHATNAPRKSYAPSTFGFESKMRFVASNSIINSHYQSIRSSGGVQQWNPSSAFQPAATYPSMFYGQNFMVPHSRSNDSQARYNRQIGGDENASIKGTCKCTQPNPGLSTALI